MIGMKKGDPNNANDLDSIVIQTKTLPVERTKLFTFCNSVLSFLNAGGWFWQVLFGAGLMFHQLNKAMHLTSQLMTFSNLIDN